MAASVPATTLTVTSLADSGPGSLRDTIATANSGDTINFAVTGTIVLSSEIQFGKNLNVVGPGAEQLIIEATNAVAMRLLHITSGTTTIADVTFRKGRRNGPGGAIYKENGNLTLNACALTNNLTQSNSQGGAIYNDLGNLTLNGCLLSNNQAIGSSGGGIFNARGVVSLFGCTLNGNSAQVGGGISSNGALTVTYSTVTGNTAAGGFSGSGGAIESINAALTVDNCIFSNNKAFGMAAGGGAIDCGGNSTDVTTSISNSTFSDNNSEDEGGAIHHGSNNSLGGTPAVMLLVSNCTFSANKAPSGGALANVGAGTSTSTAQVTSCTFSRNGNAAGNGSAIYNGIINSAAANLTVRSTILQKATGASATNFTNVGGNIISQGYNLADDSPAGFLNGPADQLGVDPQLDPLGLQYNGGVTPTIALTTGPAVDKGKNFGPIPTDQRGTGFPRTIDNPAFNNAVPGGDGTDIGAFETQGDVTQAGTTGFFVNTLADHDDGICGATDCTLREAIARANVVPGSQNIQFLVGGTIPLDQSLGPLSITTPMFVSGFGARALAISGGNSTSVFNVSAGPSFITGLTIRDGRATNFLPVTVSGAGLSNSAALTVTSCAFVNNTAAAGSGINACDPGGSAQGAAVFNAGGGNLILDRCTLSGNTATAGNGAACFSDFNPGGAGGSAQGAAVFNDTGATLTLANCTLAENTATGGNGGSNTGGIGVGGNGGAGEGAGIFNRGTLNLRGTTVARNTGSGGTGGLGSTPPRNGTPGASRGGITQNSGSAVPGNSIIALNTGSTGPDVAGSFSSEGFNLIGLGNTGTGFGATGDQVGSSANPLDPLLGPLQNNGGPTNTLALLQNSPAIDRGHSLGLTSDQRDQPRPSDHQGIPNALDGDGADIGAFEANFTLSITTIRRQPNGNILLQGKGVANTTITIGALLFPSSSAFPPIGQAAVDPTGNWQFEDENVSGFARLFYKASFP
jgi:CSLREA domain-containing protein